jgi:mannose-6-phosphate isomerase-like protein (cupin superfamily)
LDHAARERFHGGMSTLTPHITIPDPFLVMQDLVQLHARYEQTGGGFFAMEVTVAPGGGPPPLHTHPAHEFFWTLEGELTYFRQDGDELTEITGGPGTSAFIPGAVAHTYRNFSDRPGRYLGVLSPPEAMQDFLVEAGVAPGDPLRTPDEVLAIGERFGIVALPVVPEPRG